MSYRNKVIKASGYSILSEIAAKLIGPIGFLVLTRILSPQDFGIVGVATTLLGFVYVVSDMGVGKIIIQETGDNEHLKNICNAGFWFNAIFGVTLFILLVLFSKNIATLLAVPKSYKVICVMSLQVVFYSLSAVQIAIKKRVLDFKFLFYLRLITVVAPLVIAIPLAFLGFGYWSIVWGQVFGSLLSTISLWIESKWKPSFSFNSLVLRNVLSKSIWSTIEQIVMWIPLALDMYLINNNLSSSDFGIYSTSRTLFSAAIQLSLGAIMPVLYSAYSNIQNDEVLLKKSILISQKIVFAFASFMGLGVFIFRELIGQIIFTEKWLGISEIFGVIFLIMGFEYFYSVLLEGLRAKGYFRVLALNTVACVVISVPILFLVIHQGLVKYVTVRALLLYLWFPVTFFYSKRFFGISFIDCLKNSKNAIFCVSNILLVEWSLNFFNLSLDVSNLIKIFAFGFAGLMYFFLERHTIEMLFSYLKKGYEAKFD